MNVLHISKFEVLAFDYSINVALHLQTGDRLARFEDIMERSESVFADIPPRDLCNGPSYFRRNGCLVVSFDKGWYPFLCDSTGYNHPEMRCWYVPKNPVLDYVAEALRDLQLPRNGGRAFLHANGAIGHGNIELVAWKLDVPSTFLLSASRAHGQ